MSSLPITGNYWAEGRTAVKIGDQWVVYLDKNQDHRYGAVVSKDLVTRTGISDKIQMPEGMHHGSVLIITRSELAGLLN